jgi:hypothetical protein
MQATIHNLLKSARPSFNIIEEFASLSPKRKMSICDRLFVDGREPFQSTIKLLWPQASAMDLKKLENFLILLKNTAH